jgi:hypothetical protein
MPTKATELGSPPSNGAAPMIEVQEPYLLDVTIEGVADLLFHRWNVEGVDSKSKAAKGSAAKKMDDLESYVWRNDDGDLCLPGEYLRMSIINASRFKQDPRSPRKSAMDLYKAGVICVTPLASLGCKDWDYEDRRRGVVQRQGINRTRPALKAGWKADLTLLVNTPEYINPSALNETLQIAGRLIGVGDFRPTFGRFIVTSFAVQEA